MTETQQRNYRATFILNTRDYDQPIETLIGSIKESMKGVGATLGEVRDLGRKEFVRVTDKKHVGDVYVQVDFSGANDVAAKVRERFRLEKTVTRLLVESL
jgi:small subunit ribosomal protein S6